MNAMGGFIAGSIVAKLLLDKTGWNAGIREIKKDSTEIERVGLKIGAAIGQTIKALTGLAVIAAGGLVALVKKTANAGDAIYDLSQRTGIGAKLLSSYKLAAEKAGSSIEGFATGMRGLSSRMLDAKNGLAESKRAFDALGIKVTDATGRLRPLNSVMLEVADKFSRMEDGAEKAALAQDLFGRSGMELIPLLNQGAAGLREEAAMAERLGITFDAVTAAAADRFNDALVELKGGFAGIGYEIGKAFIPTFTTVVEAATKGLATIREHIEKLAKDGTLREWAVGMAKVVILAFKWMVMAIEGVLLAWETFKAAVFGSMAIISKDLAFMMARFGMALGALSKIFPALKGVEKDIAGIVKELFFASGALAETAETGVDKMTTIAASFEVFFKELNKLNGALDEPPKKIAEIGRAGEQWIPRNIDLFGDLTDKTKDATTALTTFQNLLSNWSIGTTFTPGEAPWKNWTSEEWAADIEAEFARIRAAAKGTKTELNQPPDMTRWETALQKIVMAYQLFAMAIGGIVNQAQTNATIAIENEYKTRLAYINANILDETARGEAIEALEAEYEIKRTAARRKGAEATKAIALMGAIVNTAEAVTKALTAGPIIGPILAGIIAALGAVQINLISKQPIPLAEGATFEKPTLLQNVLVGEKRPEYLLDKLKLTEIVRDAMAFPRFNSAPAMAAPGGGSASVNVTFTGPLIQTTGLSRRDLEAAGEELRRIVDGQLRRVGRRL